MSQLRIVYVLANVRAQSYYRLRLPYDTLNEMGLASCMQLPDNVLNAAELPDDVTAVMAGADVFVFHQPTESLAKGFMRKMQKLGKVCVFDYDDDLFNVSPFIPGYRKYGTKNIIYNFKGKDPVRLWQEGHNGFFPEENEARLQRVLAMLKEADAITVTTPRLSDNYKEVGALPVRALPNCLDFGLWEPLPLAHKGPLRIGWHGGESHWPDWATYGKSISKAVVDLGATLVLTGAPPVFVRTLGDIPDDQLELSYPEWVHIDAHPWRLKAANVQMAVIPLENSDFNHGKSVLKWVEYSALGIPCVMSNCPPYSDIVENESTGILVDGEDDWQEAIEALAKDPVLRHTMGQAAQEYVREHFDIRKEVVRWIDLLDTLVYSRWRRDGIPAYIKEMV